MFKKLLRSIIYGDVLQKLMNKNRAYEKNAGETEKLLEEWIDRSKNILATNSKRKFKKGIYDMVNDFEKIELDLSVKKPPVGIVGEILIKYHPFGNNYIADFLNREGAEVVLPDLMGFIKYASANKIVAGNLLKQGNISSIINKIVIKYISLIEKDVKKAFAKSKKKYLPPSDIWHLERQAKKVLSSGNQTGEGWFLTAEMIEYIEHGIPNIACVQPFACLPNHIVGKGVIKTIRNLYPNSNIAPIDYDPGASNANQINRIKLLMTVAKDNLVDEDKTVMRILIEEDYDKDKKLLEKKIPK